MSDIIYIIIKQTMEAKHMKLMIASDIHGSEYYLNKLLKAYEIEKPDKLIILGDILYHGPRNDLPKDYNPKSVISLLNPLKDKLLCVRGNCDTEVDQMVLDFPVMADYSIIFVDGKTIYMTHGHHFGEDNPPNISSGEILLCGHTHVPKCEDKNGYIYMNPGSVSIPKEGSEHSYMVYENSMFIWKSLDGSEYKKFNY